MFIFLTDVEHLSREGVDGGLCWEGYRRGQPLLGPEWRLRLLGEMLPERPLMVLCKLRRATIEKATNRLHMFKKVETSMTRKTINPHFQEAQ